MEVPPGPHPFIPFFNGLAAQVQAWVDRGLGPERIRTLLHTHCTRLNPDGGNETFFSSLQPPSSSDPPTASPLHQEELRLLRTSFDTAFASLAGQVKELADKVN